MCKLVSFCQGVSVTASGYTLIAISVDRCIVVAYPFSSMVSFRKCIVCIWVLAILVNIPWVVVYRMEDHFYEDRIIPDCVEKWPNKRDEMMFFAFACLFISYLSPLLTIVTCNFVIWIIVHKRNAIGEDIFSQQRSQIIRTRLKVISNLFNFIFHWRIELKSVIHRHS